MKKLGRAIANAWARTSLWIKVAGLAVLAVLSYILYLRLKNRGLQKEAEDLRRRNAIARAEVQVSYLEGMKERNRERLAEIPGEVDRIDRQIVEQKKAAEEARARVAGMNDEQIAARFRELGY